MGLPTLNKEWLTAYFAKWKGGKAAMPKRMQWDLSLLTWLATFTAIASMGLIFQAINDTGLAIEGTLGTALALTSTAALRPRHRAIPRPAVEGGAGQSSLNSADCSARVRSQPGVLRRFTPCGFPLGAGLPLTAQHQRGRGGGAHHPAPPLPK